jgi:hypothetical protein
MKKFVFGKVVSKTLLKQLTLQRGVTGPARTTNISPVVE